MTTAERFQARFDSLVKRKQHGCALRALHEEMVAASVEKINRVTRPYNFPDGSSFDFVQRAKRQS
jgi:hypothetical protein